MRRRASVTGTVAGIATLVAFVVSGASADLRDAVAARSGGSVVLATIAYVVAVSLMSAVVGLPFALLGVNAPGLLLECATLSSPADRERVRQEAGLHELAASIAEGIVAWQRNE